MGANGLPKGDVLRFSAPRDGPALARLIGASRWIFWGESWGTDCDDADTLLARFPGLLWLRKETILGALFFSLYRQPVAEICLLALRSGESRDPVNRQVFFGHVLPNAEAWLCKAGMDWVSLMDGAEWLLVELAKYGYHLQDRVLNYCKAGMDVHIEGNLKVQVRRMSGVDLAPVVALDTAVFDPFWRMGEFIVRQAIERSPYALVAEINRQVVGYLVAEGVGDQGYISRLAVLSAFQGQGVGTRLMREVLALMKSDGLNRVMLNTQEGNIRSRNLYERLGFQGCGASRNAWAKQLGPPGNCKAIETT